MTHVLISIKILTVGFDLSGQVHVLDPDPVPDLDFLVYSESGLDSDLHPGPDPDTDSNPDPDLDPEPDPMLILIVIPILIPIQVRSPTLI